jgi:hypothetical protein
MVWGYDMPNQISIEYSQNLPDILQITKNAFEEEAKMAMAVKLFEMKRLSTGMAARKKLHPNFFCIAF